MLPFWRGRAVGEITCNLLQHNERPAGYCPRSSMCWKKPTMRKQISDRSRKPRAPGSTRRPSRRGFALVVTLSLMVLLADVANGGMKGDLSLIAEGSKLPTELAGKSLYEAAYGLDIASDPTWEQMIGSLNLYSGSDAGGSFLSPIRRPAIVECHRAGRLECRHGSEIRPRSSGIRVAFRSCFVPLAMLPGSAQKVDIYQATRKGDRLAVVTPAENSTAVDYSLLLDPDVSHQTLLGIGSSLTESTAQVLSELSKEKREEVLSKGLPRMARIFR